MQARLLRWLPLGAGLAAFAAYTWLAAPGLYWLDSEELAAAAVQLGIPHPTGFPLFCLIGRALAWLPFGELAWRVHLGSALGAAVAVGVVVRLVIELAGEDLAAGIAGVGAALVLGGSFTFYRAATVTEVYASMAGALALGAWGLVRVARGAPAATGLSLAFFAGVVAVGLHSSFALLLVPPFLVVYLWRLLRGARWPRLAPALVVLGAGAMATYMPVRSASGTVDLLDWDHPRTAAALVDHLSAARIRRSFEGKMLKAAGSEDNLREAGRLAEGDLGTLALLAAAGGALALAWRPRGRWAAAMLVAVALGDVAYAVFVNPMGVGDRQTGVPLAVAVATLAGVGVAAGSRIMRKYAPFGAAVGAVLVAVAPVAAAPEERASLRISEAPRAWAEAALAQCPAGAIALTRSDTMGAAMFWLTIAEPDRPDVVHLIRQHYFDMPRVRSVLARAGLSLRARRVEVVQSELMSKRPVCWELGNDPLPSGATPGVPMGPGRNGPPRPVNADLDRIFPQETLGDEQTARTASDAYNNVAYMAILVNDWQRAAKLAERSVQIRPNVHAHLNAARARIQLLDGVGAKADLDAAEKLVPPDGSSELYALRGILAMNDGRCDDAGKLFAAALRLNPRQADAVANQKRLPECYAGSK